MPPPPPPPPPPAVDAQPKVYQREPPRCEPEPERRPAAPTRSAALVRLQQLSVASGVRSPIDALAAASRVPLHDTVVAFDCDLTLKAPGGVLRGGDETLALLDALRDAGAIVVVVTATRPSRENWETIMHDLDKLGLCSHLGQNHRQQEPPPGVSTWSSESGKYTSRCWEHHGVSGTPFVAGRGVICSHYNKAACLHRYLLLYGLDKARHLIFVDDFIANAVDVALHFSIQHEPEPEPEPEPDVSLPATRSLQLELEHVSALWWDPCGLEGIPVGGFEDSHSAQWEEYRSWVADGHLPDRLFEPAALPTTSPATSDSG
jgi:hypothetical protein